MFNSISLSGPPVHELEEFGLQDGWTLEQIADLAFSLVRTTLEEVRSGHRIAVIDAAGKIVRIVPVEKPLRDPSVEQAQDFIKSAIAALPQNHSGRKKLKRLVGKLQAE